MTTVLACRPVPFALIVSLILTFSTFYFPVIACDQLLEEGEMYRTGYFSADQILVDLDGDGDLDLARTSSLCTAREELGILINDGDRQFHVGHELHNDNGCPTHFRLCSIDLDGDGDNDIAAASGWGYISLYVNSGNATFVDTVRLPVIVAPHDVKAVDIDKDDDFDLVFVSHAGGTDGLGVAFNDGSGNFSSFDYYEIGAGRSSVCVADMNGDGWPDVATVGEGADGVWIHLNAGDGTLGDPTEFGQLVDPVYIIAEDFDLDDDYDIAVASRNGFGVSVFWNDGFGTMITGPQLLSSRVIYSLSAIDFDTDGDLDLVATDHTQSGIIVLMNTSHSFVTWGSHTVDALGVALATGDIDQDGKTDIVSDVAGAFSLFLWGTTDHDNCCGEFTEGFSGNVDFSADGKRNLADITTLIDRVYITKRLFCCESEGNIDGSENGSVNLGDITRLIDHVYISKVETAPCR